MNVLNIVRRRQIVLRCLFLVFVAPFGLRADASEKTKSGGLPFVSEVGEAKHSAEVPDAKLFAFEEKAREEFLSEDPPDDLYMFASSPSSIQLWDPPKYPDPRELWTLRIKRRKGMLTHSTDFGDKRSERPLSAVEIRAIREFVDKNAPDKLPRLNAERMVNGHKVVVASGTIYIYLHLTAHKGYRVWINNPPTAVETKDYPPEHSAWKYTKLVDFFVGLTKNE